MATTTSTKFIATILIFSLFINSPICDACGGCSTPTTPAPVTPAPAPIRCPLDTLKLAACADVLGIVHGVLATPPSGTPCCTLIKNLANLEAAACLCTAIKANILGNDLNIPVSLSVILSSCQKTIPEGFKCP